MPFPAYQPNPLVSTRFTAFAEIVSAPNSNDYLHRQSAFHRFARSICIDPVPVAGAAC
jgi:hypothetical protein